MKDHDRSRRRVEDDRRETLPSSSSPSSSSRTNEDGQVLIVALSTKEAALITLDNLESATIEKWGNRVIDFEAKYPTVKWDRTTIPRNVRDLINVRWNQAIYHVHLPRTLVTWIENGEGFSDDQWLRHDVISTTELFNYLKKSSSMEKKRTSFKSGYEELLEYIKGYKLSLSMDTAHKSVEKFMAVSKRLYQDSQQENRFI